MPSSKVWGLFIFIFPPGSDIRCLCKWGQVIWNFLPWLFPPPCAGWHESTRQQTPSIYWEFSPAAYTWVNHYYPCQDHKWSRTSQALLLGHQSSKDKAISRRLNEYIFDCVGKVLTDTFLVNPAWLSLGLVPGPLTSGENEQGQSWEVLAAGFLCWDPRLVLWFRLSWAEISGMHHHTLFRCLFRRGAVGPFPPHNLLIASLIWREFASVCSLNQLRLVPRVDSEGKVSLSRKLFSPSESFYNSGNLP